MGFEVGTVEGCVLEGGAFDVEVDKEEVLVLKGAGRGVGVDVAVDAGLLWRSGG